MQDKKNQFWSFVIKTEKKQKIFDKQEIKI